MPKKGYKQTKTHIQKAHTQSCITQKKENVGFYNSKIQSELGRKGVQKSHRLQKLNNTGIYGLTFKRRQQIGKLAAITNKKNKTSAFFNKELQRKNGQIGGIRSIESRRKNFPYEFNNCKFDSKGELELAINIFYQLKIQPKERKTCHVLINKKEFDFFINNVFIEYHPKNYFYHTNKIYEKLYYNIRRQILNKNGYRDYPLIVIE